MTLKAQAGRRSTKIYLAGFETELNLHLAGLGADPHVHLVGENTQHENDDDRIPAELAGRMIRMQTGYLLAVIQQHDVVVGQVVLAEV